MADRGRGRGWFYKQKYGGGGRGGQAQRGGGAFHSQQEYHTQHQPQVPSQSPQQQKLVEFLHSIDGEQYGRYKQLTASSHCLDPVSQGIQPTLFIDHIQSDPFAPPSKIRVRVAQTFAASLFDTKPRAIALSDYLTRGIHAYLTGHGIAQDLCIDVPGQQVLERTAVVVTPGFMEARLFLRLPANGRRILGRDAARLVTGAVVQLAQNTMLAGAYSSVDVLRFVDCVDDQEWLRGQLASKGLIAFVRNGAMLPRASGADDGPMVKGGIAFVSPVKLECEFVLPHAGVVKGMG
ncbi:hypothetical protein HDU98_002127, partial [Podochytrium sp. JEL0797]